MTDTTSDTRRAFADEIRQDLARCARAARARYEQTQAQFLADAQSNPASAIAWGAQDLVMAQTAHEVWAQIEADLAEHDPREVLAEHRKDAQRRVRSFFGSSSTSLFTNAVERARAEAYLRLAERLDDLAGHAEL